MRPTNRIPPQGQVGNYRTFQIAVPLKTHWRPATCAEVSCPQYLNGWRVRLDQLSPPMQHAARTSGRKFLELDVSEDEHWLVFEAGQPCFRASEHRIKLDKQEIYIARDGDYRGNPTGRVRRHTRPEFWTEEFNENQGRIEQARQQG